MTDRLFVDSNIWVYLFTHDSIKGSKAERYILDKALNNNFVISYQVVNEVSSVLKRKKYSEAEIRDVINHLCAICIVQDYSKDIALHASRLRDEGYFSFWDSLIVASAIAAQCSVLVSEDMQNGQQIENLTIKNIFA
jgi:predicted nucleic acid-binding protein